MRVREMNSGDMGAIDAMYMRSRFNFDWPEYDSGKFEQILVAEDESGIVGVDAAVKTVELYLLLEGSPQKKYEALSLFHTEQQKLLKGKMHRAVSRIYPGLKRYEKRLVDEFGWKPQMCFGKEI